MFGFDFFVVGRIDFQEKAARFATQTMETVWRPSRVGGAGASPLALGQQQPELPEIMTHVLDPIQFYGYPPGFNFEGDARSRITDANIVSRAGDFAKFIHQKRAGYATNSLLVPFGSDFQFTNATINYEVSVSECHTKLASSCTDLVLNSRWDFVPFFARLLTRALWHYVDSRTWTSSWLT
jgi:hypothetical protein